MGENKIKQSIQECKIDGLLDLAKLVDSQDNQKAKVIESFRLLSKEALEKQCNFWESMLIEVENQLNSAYVLSLDLTEDNQNDMIDGMFTIKECKFMYCRMLLSIDYYKDCIKLMKKILKTK